MSTRKLIVVALLAGLAILLAGGIQLVLLAGGDDDTDAGTTELLQLGQAATVDGVRITAHEARLVEGVLLLRVAFSPAATMEELAELGRGWALFSPDADLLDRGEVPADASPCVEASVAATVADEVRCDVAFVVGEDPRDGTYLASFRGERSWAVPLPGT